MSHRTSLIAFLLLACGGGGAPPDGSVLGDGSTLTPAQAVCHGVSDFVTRCGGGACDMALVTDCSSVTGIVSDAFLQNISSCLQAGHGPTECLAGVRGLAPSDAQRAFVNAFCSNCVFGSHTCVDAFFPAAGQTPSDFQVAGLAVLPFSDAVVNDFTSMCTHGLTCAASFVNCAEGVLAMHALPTATATCLVQQLTGQATSPPPNPSCLATDSGMPSLDDGGMVSMDDASIGPDQDGGPGVCNYCGGGCATGEVCAYDTVAQCNVCISNSGAAEGGACTAPTDCIGTFGCAFGECVHPCRMDSDCASSHISTSCAIYTDGSPGFCWNAACDPVDTTACPGQACGVFGTSPDTGELATACFTGPVLAAGSMCNTDAAFCPSGYACLTATERCERLCRQDVDCTTGSCDASTPVGFISGMSIGVCR